MQINPHIATKHAKNVDLNAGAATQFAPTLAEFDFPDCCIFREKRNKTAYFTFIFRACPASSLKFSIFAYYDYSVRILSTGV